MEFKNSGRWKMKDGKWKMQNNEDIEKTRFKKRLTNFYKDYCPAKLSDIDILTNKYFKKEKILFEKLILKYGEEKNKYNLPPRSPTWRTKYKDRCGSFEIFYGEDTKDLLSAIDKSKGPISQSILDKI